MSRIFYIIIFFLIFNYSGLSQNRQDSLNTNSKDSVFTINQDTLAFNLQDSLKIDSLDNDSLKSNQFNQFNISKDAIEGDIDWGAKDLEYFDKDSNKLKLYNEAYVNYGTISLKAGYIEYDLNKSEIIGIPIIDSSGISSQKPSFTDKGDEFTARLIRYNIKSKKGWVEYASKKEGDLTIHGDIGKFVSAEADTIHQVDKMFIKDGLITNCTNKEHPHWGIKASKIKLIPNKLAVFGYSILEIADVPIYPIILPFGFYPMFQGQKSGLILPKRLDYNNDFGVGVKDVGVYFAINDYIDLRLTGDIYSRGSHGIYIQTNYSKRYKYSGKFNFSYFNAIREATNDTIILKSPSFSISLSHNQSPKAHPYQKFGGNLNFSLNGYQRTAHTDANNKINNIIRSNFSYTNSLPNTPFSMAVALNHSQNNSTRKFDLTLPNITLNMNTIYPFKSKKRVGKEKWFEKISLGYRGAAKNVINATDTTIFTPEVFDKMKYGMTQNASTSVTFRILKYINASIGINYDEKHFFKTIEKSFDNTIQVDTVKDSAGKIVYDTENNIVFDTIYGNVITDTISKWKVYRHVSPSLRLSTNRYGKILFNKGWLRGVKHKVSYSVSLSGNPFDERSWYNRTVQTDTRDEYNTTQEYSIFDYSGAYGSANPQNQNLILNYSINNLFEAKVFSKRDSSLKKIPLLKNLSITGNYNITADSLKFSRIRIGFNLSLFKNFVTLRYSGQLDPYMKVNNIRVNKFVWDDKKFPVRHDFSNVSISIYNKSFDQIIGLFMKKDGKRKKGKKVSKNSKIDNDKLSNILKNFRLNYNLNMKWENNSNNVDTFYVSTHSIRVSGTIPLTKNWRIKVNNFDYNLKDKRFEYPDFGFERDLHCWKMNFSWQPKGGSYSFFIGVKSSILEFVKYQHGVDPIRANLNNNSF